jgi:hypothetical protein
MMNCSPTISAEEFKTIHNAVCNLDSICHQLEDILKPELYLKLVKARNGIRDGLAGAYEQDHEAFSRKSRHYDEVKADLGIKNSEWSIYEVDNMNDRHPYQGATVICYKNHWGEKPVSSAINGSTWAALWVAANAAIRDSSDEHHVYVEQFRQSQENPEVLYLSTGS